LSDGDIVLYEKREGRNTLFLILGIIGVLGAFFAVFILLAEFGLPNTFWGWIFGISFTLFLAISAGIVSALYLGIFIYGLSELWMRMVSSKYRAWKKYKSAKERYRNWLLRIQIEFWQSLKGRRLEIEVAALYRRLGYEVELTPASGDIGIDIIMQKDEQKIVVQCKGHKNPVTPSVVRELYGSMQHAKVARAILVSTGGFTKGTIEFAYGKSIELVDMGRLVALQSKL